MISVDRERCMGSGLCLVYAPGVFGQDEETKAVVLDPGGEPAETVRVAAEACPTGAIQLVPADGA
jgi:ferredoxin